MSGYFITFEGSDGAGKSTQIALLEAFLSHKKKIDVVRTREPGGSKISEDIRQYVLENSVQDDPYRDLLLFSAARLFNVELVIAPALAQKKVVLCDRFTDSSWVYQVKEGGVDEHFANDLEKIACRGIVPDLTFILDLPAEDSLKRIFSRNKLMQIKLERFEKENINQLESRRAYFIEKAKQDPKRYIVIDALLPIKEMASKIEQIVWKKLGALGYL